MGFTLIKSNHQRCSIKQPVVKIFAIFLGRRLCWSHIFIKLQVVRPATLSKRDSNTGVFL